MKNKLKNIIAMLDQLMLLDDFAPVLWSYYKSLLNAGFNEEQALRIAINFQDGLMQKSSN